MRDIEALGRRAVALHCDLMGESAVTALLPQAIKALGSVSCVVNNAANFERDSVDEFSYGALDAHMRTNLAAPVLLARALHAAKTMAATMPETAALFICGLPLR